MSKNWKLYEFTGKGHGHLYFMEAKCRICLEKGDSGYCSGEWGAPFHKRESSSHVKHPISEEACLKKLEETQEELKDKNIKLGKNFMFDFQVATKPWNSGSCTWAKLHERDVGNFRIRLLRKREERKVAQVWAMGFPELFRGTYHFVLEPESYEIFFGGEWRMFVFETEDREIAGARILRMDSANLSVEFVLVVVLPEHRGKGLAKGVANVMDQYVKNCGAELATVACATFHTATRKIFRQLGFQPVGVLPGAIRANVGGNSYRRDSVELLYKLYGDAAALVPAQVDFLEMKKERGI